MTSAFGAGVAIGRTARAGEAGTAGAPGLSRASQSATAASTARRTTMTGTPLRLRGGGGAEGAVAP